MAGCDHDPFFGLRLDVVEQIEEDGIDEFFSIDKG